MLFTCLPEGAPIPGRFPGPAHARGKWFTIDIHCHVTSLKAAAMVEGNEAVSRWFLETQANARSQDDQSSERRADTHNRAPRRSSASPTWT